jgi:hypothetical protein
MKLGEWYNIVYTAGPGNKMDYWVLPLKDGPAYMTLIRAPKGGLKFETFTSEFVDKYGRRKKKPEDIKVNYKTTRNAVKAIFGGMRAIL